MSSIIARMTSDPISLDALERELSRSENGAQLVFSGVVRDNNHGRRVVAVTYDAHARLAEETFREIGEEARARWGEELAVAILHRSGRVVVGEACLVIAVGSPHREAAFEASRWVLDEFKARSPVRKQEHYADGGSEWLKAKPLRATTSVA
jgi:molybdopterin synthase catalytic subunit